jgi:hypothetical protein
VSTQDADLVRHVAVLPKGYFQAATGDMLPWFDNEGRVIVLRCHADGSVTWQMLDKDEEVLEP